MQWILHVYGSGCTSLFLDFADMFTPHQHLHDVFSLNGCKVLKNLCVHGAHWDEGIGDVIAVLGPGLQRLELCTRLSHVEGLTRMLESVGGTLQSLALTVYRLDSNMSASNFDLRTIASFCPQITEIYLKAKDYSTDWFFTSRFREEELELYCKYGEQLTHVHLSFGGFTKAFLTRLASVCPNVCVDISEIDSSLYAWPLRL